VQFIACPIWHLIAPIFASGTYVIPYYPMIVKLIEKNILRHFGIAPI